ncbi:MAG: hypothetical protein HKN88_06050 [Gammaproteobacteria bacterium]|nr:hypothetical protein [Gammaproteobacteria bacterium]NNC97619.1 hypothetical protein [Gammaproteobacteria bacterium]NNM14195.1 hypothetical protein [Gammaproteobacteria bacterium]
MAEIILYITKSDAPQIVEWLNNDDEIAWIIKADQNKTKIRWKAVHSITSVTEGEYCLWIINSGILRIPSGDPNIKDTHVLDPFKGWEQRLDDENIEIPWFGAPAPETFVFKFYENGFEEENSLARSGFFWIGNYFAEIGIPAPDESKKWWNKLKRFVKKNSTGIPWSKELGTGRTGAYAFHDAYKQLQSGRPKDVNL